MSSVTDTAGGSISHHGVPVSFVPEPALSETEIAFRRECSPQQSLSAFHRFYGGCKRVLDVLTAAVFLLLAFPLLLLIAAAVYAWDRGPIFYTQTRIGQGGQPFRFFKFRSMVVNADTIRETLSAQNEASGPIFKMRRDPRVTPVGRLLRRGSLDELPQLYNVLKGDMSLVGPRPQRPAEVEQYLPHHYQRLSAPQGLICLREVSGRSNLSFERWLELDLHYIERRSFATDLKILCSAIPAVLRGEGAY